MPIKVSVPGAELALLEDKLLEELLLIDDWLDKLLLKEELLKELLLEDERLKELLLESELLEVLLDEDKLALLVAEELVAVSSDPPQPAIPMLMASAHGTVLKAAFVFMLSFQSYCF